MARPNQSERTKRRIVEAAVGLIDSEGLEALSTRRLASELGIRGPTLYHYFADKEALLAAVREHLAVEIWAAVDSRIEKVPAGDWQQLLRGYVTGAVGAMSRHPNAVSLMALNPVSNRHTLESYDKILGRLTDSGWGLTTAWRVFLAAENLVLSAALEVGAPDFSPEPDRTEGLPHIGELVKQIAGKPRLDEGFAIGLDALIVGLEVVHNSE